MEAAAAIIAGNRLIARLNVEGAIESSGNNVDTWLLYAWTSDSPAAAQLAINRALEIDPENELARAGQRWVQGIESTVTELVNQNDQEHSDSTGEPADGSTNLVESVNAEIESAVEYEELEASRLEPLAILEGVFSEAEEVCDSETETSDQEVESSNDACFAGEGHVSNEPVLESSVEDSQAVESSDSDFAQANEDTSTEVAEAEAEIEVETHSAAEISDSPSCESESLIADEVVDSASVAEEMTSATTTDEPVAEAMVEVESVSQCLEEAGAPELHGTTEDISDESVETLEPVASVITNEELQQVFDSNRPTSNEMEATALSVDEQLDDAPVADAASLGVACELTATADEPAATEPAGNEPTTDSFSDPVEAPSCVADSQNAAPQEEPVVETDALGALQETIEDLAAAIPVPSVELPVADGVAVTESVDIAPEQELFVAPTVSTSVIEEQIAEDVQAMAQEVSEATQAQSPAPVVEAPTEAAEVTAEPAGTQPTVMIVDDSPTIRKLVSMTLSRNGFNVVAANDGVEALKILAEQRPDIILSDINMPRLGGYQLCKFVKKHARTKLIPVLLLSGKDGVFDKMRGKMAGCNGYITKPFESADLVHQVRRQLLSATAT